MRKLVLALVLVSGCGEKAAPVLAAQEFASVMQRGDAKALIPLVELEAAARLERAATRASDQVGGRRNIELYEMVQIVDVPDSFRVATSELVEADDSQAQVALIGADGTRYLLDMVYQEGSWRVRVPMPPGEEAP